MITLRRLCEAFDAMPWPAVVGLGMFIGAAYLVLDAVWGER